MDGFFGESCSSLGIDDFDWDGGYSSSSLAFAGEDDFNACSFFFDKDDFDDHFFSDKDDFDIFFCGVDTVD
jgi:hypothetical protein